MAPSSSWPRTPPSHGGNRRFESVWCYYERNTMTNADYKLVIGCYAFLAATMVAYLLGVPNWVMEIGCLPGIAMMFHAYLGTINELRKLREG